MTIHPVLSAATEALAQRGVRWALLWTPAGGLLQPRGDLDLLVATRDRDAMLGALRWLGFVRRPSSSRAAHLVQYCPDTDTWLWLHVVTSFRFGNAGSISFEALDIQSGHEGLDLPRPAADAAFWMLLWHNLAKGAIAAHHRPALQNLAQDATCDSAASRQFARACGNAGLVPSLLDAVRRGSWTFIEAVARNARTHNAPSATERIRRRSRGVIDAVRNWHHARGVSVALLGPDGAGKSTLVNGLRTTVPLPSRAIPMGLTGGALAYARRLRVPGLVFAGTTLVIWSRYLRARYHQARGRLVVFDRYTYDAVAPHPAPLTRAQRLSRQFSGHLCPPPDLLLILDAPGAVMYARKHAYEAATLECWRHRFLTLAQRFPSRAHVIDATAPPDAVRVAAATRLWQAYAMRWAKV